MLRFRLSELKQRYALGERHFSDIDLSGLDLSGWNLEDIELLGVNLQGANLQGTHLEKAKIAWLSKTICTWFETNS